MDLIIDASTVVGEALRSQGQQLLRNPNLTLYVAEKAWDEIRYEVRRRADAIIRHTGGDATEFERLLESAESTINDAISVEAFEFYAVYEAAARARIPADPNDWETVALAMARDLGIWTADRDFFGCGCATWTTQTLRAHLGL